MDIGHAVIKAVVQGLTEFLPVSSSAHLIFTEELSKILGWQTSGSLIEAEFYDIFLHVGTLIAVVYYFRKDLTIIVLTLLNKKVSYFEGYSIQPFEAKSLIIQIMATTSITVVFILSFLKGSEWLMASMGWATPQVTDISEYYRAHPMWVGFHLILTGCLLFFTEHYASRKNQATETSREISKPFTLKQACVIGLFQGVAAIFRGISRSGSTISGGLVTGVDRLTATRYSFLISIPAFLLAIVYEVMKIKAHGLSDDLDWPTMIIGVMVTMFVAYFCVKYFVRFVAKHSLKGFAYYCWAVGAFMALYFGLRGFV